MIQFLHLNFYLCGKQSCSSNSNPAVQGVHIRDVVDVVVVEHRTKSHDGQDQSEEHQRSMEELPGEFILTPGQGNAVQHSSCKRGTRREKMN